MPVCLVTEDKIIIIFSNRYINTYIWNLEILYWWTYVQGSNRDTENRTVDTVGRERMGWMQSTVEAHILPYAKQPVGIWCMAQGAQTGALWQPSGEGWGDRWERSSRGRGHVYTYGWYLLMDGRHQHNTIMQ